MPNAKLKAIFSKAAKDAVAKVTTTNGRQTHGELGTIPDNDVKVTKNKEICFIKYLTQTTSFASRRPWIPALGHSAASWCLPRSVPR